MADDIKPVEPVAAVLSEAVFELMPLDGGKASTPQNIVPDCAPTVFIDHTALGPSDEVEVSIEVNGVARVSGRVHGGSQIGMNGLPTNAPATLSFQTFTHVFIGSPQDKARLVIPGKRPADRPDFPQWTEDDGSLVHFVGTQKEYDSNYTLKSASISGDIRATVIRTKGTATTIPIGLSIAVKQ